MKKSILFLMLLFIVLGTISSRMLLNRNTYQLPQLRDLPFYPDNVLDADCWTLPGEQDWAIQQVQQIATVATTAPFTVGDLNGDGFPDIVAYGNKARTSIKIIWGPEFTNIKEITGLGADTHTTLAIAKVKISEDPAPEYQSLIFYRSNTTLCAIRPDGTSAWATNPNCRIPGIISFADFNRDGWTEVYVGNQIYDAATGNLLCDGGKTYNTGTTMLVLSNVGQSFATDILGDEDLELVAGNQIFKVEIDRTVTTAKPLTLLSSVTPPTNCPADGITVVADFNNDGKLEVLVRRRQYNSGGNHPVHLYLWSPHTGTSTGVLLANATDTHRYFGVPFVGDIDGDGEIEIVTLGSNGYYQLQDGFKARKYNESTGSFDLFWNIRHMDQSGATGMTLFDFNLDGISEIVYRDESNLQIINGSLKSHITGVDTTVYTLNSFTSYSETYLEYPVVVDIYGNHSSAILVTSDLRGPRNSSASDQGYDGIANIDIYTSDPAMPWAPARPVWNQYAYNPTFVNKDLTIPAERFDITTIFEGKDSIMNTSDDYRPYNSFLQQAPIFNKYGAVILLAPDYFIYPEYTVTYYSGDSVKVKFDIGNQGDAAVTPLHISAYKNDYSVEKLLGTNTYNYAPAIGAKTSYSLMLYNVSLQDHDEIILSVNDEGVAHIETPECDATNNRSEISFSSAVIAADDFAQTLPQQPVEINVLENDIIPASCSDPAISIVTAPLKGDAVFNGNVLEYRSRSGFTGPDSLTYKVSCGNYEGVAKVYIRIIEYPDNISDADCYVDPDATQWNLELLKESKDNYLSWGTVLAGDVDDDGNVEIIVQGKRLASQAHYSNQLFILDNDLNVKYTINTPNYSNVAPSFAIANVDGTGKAAVFLATVGRQLIKYVYDQGVYVQSWSKSYSSNPNYDLGSPLLADFNGDGLAEVLIYDKVFDALTGDLLVDGGFVGTSGTAAGNSYSFGLGGHSSEGTNAKVVSFMVLGDIDGDGSPEAIGGDCAYKVKINSRTDTSQNSFELFSRADKSSRTDIGDGATSLADIDLDGKTDVIVTRRSGSNNKGVVYIWNPRTGEIINSNEITDIPVNDASKYGPSVAFIGDLDKDGYPEIALTGNSRMIAYDFDILTGILSVKWSRPTTDTSASTTMSLFDFNQDGESELIYRDHDYLRILKGDTGIDLNAPAVRCGSATANEYPIVVDVNNDGSAEIIVVGNTAGYSHEGTVRIYGSNSTKWAPARKVWNQFAYNAVNVNEDLTIPAYQSNPSAVFPGEHGIYGDSDDTRPYNAFLQQQTTLNKNGNPLFLVPDIVWNSEPLFDYFADGDSIKITINIGNTGSAGLQAPVYISTYKNEISVENLLTTVTYPQTINVGDNILFSFKIEDFNSISSLSEIIIRLNDKGEASFYQQECDTLNNAKIIKFNASGFDDYYGMYNDGSGIIKDFNILENDIVDSDQMTRINSLVSSAGSVLSVNNDQIQSLKYQPPVNFCGIDTIKYISSGLSSLNIPVVVSGTVYIYLYSDCARYCYDPSGVYPSIRIEDAAFDVTVDWIYHSSDTHGNPAGSDANILNTSIMSGKDNFILEAVVRFNVSSIAVAAFNNNIYTPFILEIVPLSLYWNQNANNSNWNDPQNWTNAEGNIQDVVPLGCTSVHIPGNASYYPSLDSLTTIRGIYYGDPECDSIIYHFGGEVAKPHYLSYNKAFVHYNFGYYDTGNTFVVDQDEYSAPVMSRDRWYALSAPLKSIYTGDFSLGGFPNTWQRGFKTSRDRTSDLIGEWYNPENTVSLEIGPRQNYAISLYVPAYHESEPGENDHEKLNDLKGIFEIPYFENEQISNQHRIHKYYPVTKTSRFYYYYYSFPGMPIEENAYEDFIRKDEAYRFVFEDVANKPDFAFKVQVVIEDKDGDNLPDDVMIGNPFISSFDFESFYQENAANIEDYYRVYTDGNFDTYAIGMNMPLIAPMQAFFIRPKGMIGSDVELTFSPEVSVARSNELHQLKSGYNPDNLLKINIINDSGSSWMIISQNPNVNRDIVRLFSEDKPEVPQIFAWAGVKEKTTIQTIEQTDNEISIPLGIKTVSPGNYELKFENVKYFYTDFLFLIDLEMSVVRDLTKNNSYPFLHKGGNMDNRFILYAGKQYDPTFINENIPDYHLKIYVANKKMFVNSEVKIKQISVLNSQGIRVFSDSQVKSNYYTRDLYVSEGIYIVHVELENGETKIEKVHVK